MNSGTAELAGSGPGSHEAIVEMSLGLQSSESTGAASSSSEEM